AHSALSLENRIPTEFRPKAQGCEVGPSGWDRATLENRRGIGVNANGGVASSRCTGHSPVGVGARSRSRARVARASQPWLEDTIPLGLAGRSELRYGSSENHSGRRLACHRGRASCRPELGWKYIPRPRRHRWVPRLVRCTQPRSSRVAPRRGCFRNSTRALKPAATFDASLREGICLAW